MSHHRGTEGTEKANSLSRCGVALATVSVPICYGHREGNSERNPLWLSLNRDRLHQSQHQKARHSVAER